MYACTNFLSFNALIHLSSAAGACWPPASCKHLVCHHCLRKHPFPCFTLPCRVFALADADDLAFLAVWKRVIAKRTQAASEAEGLRQASKKLKRSLLTSEEEARQLRGRLDEEAAARAEAEQQLKELQVKHTKLQEQHKEQHKVGS
jgi:septal ring factor EnvC (AmiA/AmiB activator)